MKSVLLLDDDPNRATWFLNTFPGAVWVHTASEALRWMRNRVWDLIFLDHDLGEGKPDGSLLASLMSKQRLQTNAVIVVHSMNPDGARRMFNTISKYHDQVGLIPFNRVVELVDQGESLV